MTEIADYIYIVIISNFIESFFKNTFFIVVMFYFLIKLCSEHKLKKILLTFMIIAILISLFFLIAVYLSVPLQYFDPNKL